MNKEKVLKNIVSSRISEYYAVVPPLEAFMEVPWADCREHFFAVSISQSAHSAEL